MPMPIQHRGFVLLMVLVVLVIAGSLLAVSARRSAQEVLASGAAERELEMKWGSRTLETLAMVQAEELLDHRPAMLDLPPAITVDSVTLGGTVFDVVVTDEQAKANVNRVAAWPDKERLQDVLSALGAGRSNPEVVLRPVEMKSGEIRNPPLLYAGLEQVFVTTSPQDLLGAKAYGDGPVGRITCWGNGKVNVRRAERIVLRQMLWDVLDEYQLHQLLVLREEKPGAGLGEMLPVVETDKDKRVEIEKRLTDSSKCHAVWIVAHGSTRNWYRLTVRQAGDEANDAGQWTFAW